MSIIVVYFALQYPRNGRIGANNLQTWWGNTVATRTADYGVKGAGTPLLVNPDGQPFGYVCDALRTELENSRADADNA